MRPGLCHGRVPPVLGAGVAAGGGVQLGFRYSIGGFWVRSDAGGASGAGGVGLRTSRWSVSGAGSGCRYSLLRVAADVQEFVNADVAVVAGHACGQIFGDRLQAFLIAGHFGDDQAGGVVFADEFCRDGRRCVPR